MILLNIVLVQKIIYRIKLLLKTKKIRKLVSLVMKYRDIIVIVPTLNNDLTIQNVVDDILSFGYKVIVIDDGYTNPVSNF